MTDKTLAQRTQQAVERPFEPPSVSGTRRISFMFPPNTPLSGSTSTFFASLPSAGGRGPGCRHWLPLPRLRIFPSRRRPPNASGGHLSVLTEQRSLPSVSSPQNQPTVPLLDPAALNSLVPTDALQLPVSSYALSEPCGVKSERLSVIREPPPDTPRLASVIREPPPDTPRLASVIREPPPDTPRLASVIREPPPDTPRLASADSDSGVGESSCGTEAPGRLNAGSDIYNTDTSASGGRPLSFAGIPLIDASDGEGDATDAADDPVSVALSLHRSSTRQRRRPALLELSSVDESVGPVPAVDIDGNVTFTRSTRQHRLAGAVCVMNNKARMRGKKKMEGKMAVRAVLIIVAFLLFWLPLVVCAVVSESLLSTDFDRWAALLADLQVATVCFCNLSVVANPVLYGLMVQQYRAALRQILPARLRGCALWRRAGA